MHRQTIDDLIAFEKAGSVWTPFLDDDGQVRHMFMSTAMSRDMLLNDVNTQKAEVIARIIPRLAKLSLDQLNGLVVAVQNRQSGVESLDGQSTTA